MIDEGLLERFVCFKRSVTRRSFSHKYHFAVDTELTVGCTAKVCSYRARGLALLH